MPLHDPFVVADDSTRTYHLYTSNEPSVSGVDGTGTMVYRSRDLRDWTRPVVVFLASEQRELWASDGGWAPEVHERDGRYYLFTTLHNEDRPLPVPPANQWGTPFQVANYMRGTITAVSDSLLGPFTVVQSVRDHDPHAPLPRSAFLVVYDRADTATYEARVDLTTGTLTSWTHLPGIQPAIMIEEIMALDDIVKKDPRAVAALERHGVHDLDLLQIDPWSTGTLPIDGIDARRRIIRASAYVRTFPEDNGYARPVGNLVFVIDCNEQSVAAIIEGDPIPVPRRAETTTSTASARSERICARWRSPSPTARRSRWTDTSSSGSGGGCTRISTPSKDSSSAMSPTSTGTVDGRSCTVRASARWSCPTATPATTSTSATSSTPASTTSGRPSVPCRWAATALVRSAIWTRCRPTNRVFRTP